jgi:hypothetical protein
MRGTGARRPVRPSDAAIAIPYGKLSARASALLTGLSGRPTPRCWQQDSSAGLPDMFVTVIPHHVLGYAEDQVTSLDETLPVCEVLHRDLHVGHKTVRLRDGRYVNEHGFVDEPDLNEYPPF